MTLVSVRIKRPDWTYRLVIRLTKALFRVLGLRIDLRGVENLPLEGGAVLASNHLSFFDFMFVGLVGVERGRLTRFLAKRGVFALAPVRGAMNAMGHIPVDRFHGEVALRRAVRRAAAGDVVGIFPEAMISHSFALRPFQPGAAAVSIQTQTPLVPVALWGTQRTATVGGRFAMRFGRARGAAITILVGEALRPGPDADPTEVTAVLRARVDDLVQRAMDEYPQRPRSASDAWWLPASRGGSAPTVAQGLALDEAALLRSDPPAPGESRRHEDNTRTRGIRGHSRYLEAAGRAPFTTQARRA